jgi:hypothetical protein
LISGGTSNWSVLGAPPPCSLVLLSAATSSICFGFGGATGSDAFSAEGWKISIASPSTLPDLASSLVFSTLWTTTFSLVFSSI